MIKKTLFCLLTLLASAQTSAAETGLVLKADQLRADTFNDAKVVGRVNKNDSVEILNKKGAWLEIKSAGKSGWVRLLTVKRNNAGGTDVAGVVGVATGRSGTGKVVSTTGIRGLSAEDLKTAQFNETETKKLESYTANADEAKQFASSGGLTSRSYPYFTGAAQ
ncbi:SH3 domain-containing protein [Methylophilus medardicus]|uniref:SH3 domain-containing protein n=1 Tax=Methylophilus medardicus TaxID=2588534 RepID=A0A5B8CRH2_9PROT|nr:SH3 domain-containing protein [Methylophilus medardicus]QDC43881.1 SH3 domain-containing protein [Methylophilus medardicus]QDC48888.1 SH3 domain-containing protein [Methylophilus medardicus]QDC52593.1 SH3 domain-containing protein [Methylophilus medardicus]